MLLDNYFKAAWRSLVSHKWYSAINITGLAVGAAVALLIGLWISDEWTFDHYHAHYGQLAQVMDVQTIKGEANTEEAIAIPLSRVLRNQFSNEFKRIAIVFPAFTHTVAVGDKKISASGIWAEPDLPEMLTLQMRKGGRDALRDPGSVLIAQSLASTLFGRDDPMNKIIRLDNMATVKVAGVYEDLPQNTTFYGTLLILAWDKALTVLPWLRNYQTDWGTRYWKLFVEMKEGVPVDRASAQVKNIVKPLVKGNNEALLLHPMSRWHLYSEFKNGQVTGGRRPRADQTKTGWIRQTQRKTLAMMRALGNRVFGDDGPVIVAIPLVNPAVHFGGDGGQNGQRDACLLCGFQKEAGIFSCHAEFPGGLSIIAAGHSFQSGRQRSAGVPGIEQGSEVANGDLHGFGQRQGICNAGGEGYEEGIAE